MTDQPAAETAPSETAPSETAGTDAPAAPASRSIAPTGQLTNAKDHAPRPGFRSPPNNNTKAQKPAPKKRK